MFNLELPLYYFFHLEHPCFQSKYFDKRKTWYNRLLQHLYIIITIINISEPIFPITTLPVQFELQCKLLIPIATMLHLSWIHVGLYYQFLYFSWYLHIHVLPTDPLTIVLTLSNFILTLVNFSWCNCYHMFGSNELTLLLSFISNSPHHTSTSQ